MHSFFEEYAVFANIGLQKEDIVLYTVTDSTNTRAREAFISDENNAPKLFIAEEQTAGRGTRERSFESRPGGLYFSFLFIPDSEEYDPSRITPLAAAAVYGALKALLGKRTCKSLFIKWVNDLFFDKKKIAGILSEKIISNGKNGYIIGIGINLYGSDFSPEVARIAASLETVTGARVDKFKLLYEILARLIPALKAPKASRLNRIYRKNSLKRGTEITVSDSLGNVRRALVLGLDRLFRLRVRYENGEKASLISGDVGIKI